MSELKQLGLELGQILQLAPLLLLLKSGVEGHLLTLTNHQSQTVLDLVESPAISRFIKVPVPYNVWLVIRFWIL